MLLYQKNKRQWEKSVKDQMRLKQKQKKRKPKKKIKQWDVTIDSVPTSSQQFLSDDTWCLVPHVVYKVDHQNGAHFECTGTLSMMLRRKLEEGGYNT